MEKVMALQKLTVVLHAKPGAGYHRGHTFAKGHVELAVVVAAAFLQAPPATTRSAPATPA